MFFGYWQNSMARVAASTLKFSAPPDQKKPPKARLKMTESVRPTNEPMRAEQQQQAFMMMISLRGACVASELEGALRGSGG